MKKIILTVAAGLLIFSMLSGCGKTQSETPVVTESIVTTTVDTIPAEAEDYAQQIERYYTAISDKWDEDAYFEHEMSPMVTSYYEGTALDNVGYAFLDLDGDGTRELVIGAIIGSEKDPLVFEIWTLKNGVPEMLAQSGVRNRYYLQYAEDDNAWSVAYEAENGAANYAAYYLRLVDGKFEVIQGIVFDAIANENSPWFMAYNLDWDVSNDTPTDEATANGVMKAERNIYTALEYIPYSMYK